MPKELRPDDRMQVMGVGDLRPPGCCAVCGNGTHPEGYVHLGINFAYEGEIYLCMTCVTECAETAGLLSAPEVKHIQAVNEELATDNAGLKQELADKNERLEHYDDLFGDASGDTSVGSAFANPRSPKVEPEQPDGGVVTESPVEQGSGESESPEPVKSPGPSEPTRPERSDIRL